eukprot:3125044-Rhodomonas_salina.1
MPVLHGLAALVLTKAAAMRCPALFGSFLPAPHSDPRPRRKSISLYWTPCTDSAYVMLCAYPRSTKTPGTDTARM